MTDTPFHRKAPAYIAIEGPIGVGKTSLAKRLAATFNYDMLLENSEENPFLERFYHNPKRQRPIPPKPNLVSLSCGQLSETKFKGSRSFFSFL